MLNIILSLTIYKAQHSVEENGLENGYDDDDDEATSPENISFGFPTRSDTTGLYSHRLWLEV